MTWPPLALIAWPSIPPSTHPTPIPTVLAHAVRAAHAFDGRHPHAHVRLAFHAAAPGQVERLGASVEEAERRRAELEEAVAKQRAAAEAEQKVVERGEVTEEAGKTREGAEPPVQASQLNSKTSHVQ